MSLTDGMRVGKSAPMDRYTARRQAEAIKQIPGFKVLSVHSVPGADGAYVIDVEDRITKLKHTVTSAADWIDVRGASARARRLMVQTNRFPDAVPEASDVAEAPLDDPAPAPPPTREEPKTMTGPTQPSSGGFNFAQWQTITRGAIEKAEQEISRLQGERGQLEEQLRRRKQEIDGQVAELRGTVKKLQRAIDDVDRPVRTPATNDAGRSSVPKSGPTASKWGPIALEWAKTHGGEVRTAELGKAQGVPSSRFNVALVRLAERGQVTQIAPGHFRVVNP